MAEPFTGSVEIKRIAELTERLLSLGAYNLIIDKAGDPDSYKITFETLNSKLLHNSLSTKQGGQADQYYHLTSAQLTSLVDLILTGKNLAGAISDVTSDLEVGTSKAIFFAPYDMELTTIFAGVGTVATGANIIVDVNVNGVSILSTKISIDVSESTSLTAATPPVLSTTSLAKGDKIEVDIDQIGSTIAGKALTLYMY